MIHIGNTTYETFPYSLSLQEIADMDGVKFGTLEYASLYAEWCREAKADRARGGTFQSGNLKGKPYFSSSYT